MKWSYPAPDLLGRLGLSLEPIRLEPGAPGLPLPPARLLIAVEAGRLGLHPEASSLLPSLSTGLGRILALTGGPGRGALLRAAGKETTLLRLLALDRDPFARPRAPAFLREAGELGGSGRSPWEGEGVRLLDPGEEGFRLFLATLRSLELALARPAPQEAPAKESQVKEAWEFCAAAALSSLLALASCAPALEPANPARGPWTVEEIVAWVDAHFEESFSLEEMVERSALNSGEFSRRFKAVAGSPLFEYLNRRRIARAALLLKSGELPVTEIAFAVGYNNLSFFNRYFLRLMGQTPTEYRRSSR